MKKLASTISAALLVAVLAVGLAATGAADDHEDSEDSDVDVTVSSEVALDVRPTEMSYSDASPGQSVEESDDGFSAVEIENIGSESINEIWAESSSPDESPFGTGDSDSYNTGNFIQIATETVTQSGDYDDIAEGISESNTNMHYVQRQEFQEETAPSYIQTLEGDETEAESIDDVDVSGLSETEVGRFRSGEEEFFYVIYHEDDGCNADGSDRDAAVLVGDTPHTPDQVGTTDFTDEGDDFTVYNIADEDGDTVGTYGLATNVLLDAQDGERDYNVLARCQGDEDSHTFRTRYNPEFDGEENTDGEQRYILEGGNALQPGANFPLDMRVEVPLGVAQGELGDDENPGSLTVFARDTDNGE